MGALKLSIVVPCYNEEKRFKAGFDHYLTFLQKQKYTWELIFVNDGSTDKTLDLIKKSATKNQNIKVVTYSQNRGKGFAICQGIKVANGRYILFSDLDHSVPIWTVNSFFKYFNQGFNAVIGSRRVKGAKLLVRQPILREYLGRGFTLLVRIFVDFKIKDSTCGFKAFESSVAKKLFSKISIYGWAFDAEILFLCKKLKVKYAQAPVQWSDVGGSQVRLKKDILRSLFGLVKIRANNISGKYDL